MSFENIIGQKEVVTGLISSIKNDRVGHAYIFSGSKGIGKRTVAREFAKILLCKGNDTGISCGERLPCRLSAGGSNPDFCVIESDNPSIGIDEIRRIQGDIIIKPLYSKRKVYLIVDAGKMTVQAQNCLLKTLEEPPGYAVVILTASSYDVLLETINSRAVKYNFKKNTRDEVCGLLELKFGRSLKNVDFIASHADGIIGTALKLAGSEEFFLLREKTIEVLLKITGSKLLGIFGAYEFFETNRNHIDAIFDIMLSFYRDILIAKKSGTEKILINSDKKDIILNSVSGFSTHKLVKNMEVIESTYKNIKQNVNFQLSMEVMLMKLQEEGS